MSKSKKSTKKFPEKKHAKFTKGSPLTSSQRKPRTVLRDSIKKPSVIHRFLEKHNRTNTIKFFSGTENPDLDSKFGKEHKLPPSLGSLNTLDRRTIEPLSDDAISLGSSMVDPLTVYRFRLGGYTTLSKSSGVINAFLAADPSASGWNSPEWSTLSALFSEFRLVALSARIVRNENRSASTNVYSLAVCSNLGTAVNPGSYAACADNADCVFYSYLDTARYRDGISGYVHTMKGTELGWSEVTTPTVAPYAGAPGSIQFYSDNGAASGTDSNVFQIIISGIYDFRVRV
jgi:hypothetical protein